MVCAGGMECVGEGALSDFPSSLQVVNNPCFECLQVLFYDLAPCLLITPFPCVVADVPMPFQFTFSCCVCTFVCMSWLIFIV